MRSTLSQTPETHESTAPGLRGSVLGVRGCVTVWLPMLLLAATGLWWLIAGVVPTWWATPSVILAVVLSGDPVIRVLLHLARDLEAQRRRHREAMTEGLTQDRPQTPRAFDARGGEPAATASGRAGLDAPRPEVPLRGGFIIGVLERLAVCLCLITGYPNGVAIVIAIKGLARYGEFTNPQQREQFIIGTLASLLWAAAGAGMVLLLT